MKKIFALCVVCLFIATVCQAADSKFNPRKEQDRACACSKVDAINVTKFDTPEKLDKAMKKQLESDLIEIEKIAPKNLSNEEKEVIEDAQNMINELKGYEISTPPFAYPGITAKEAKRMLWEYTTYLSNEEKPITIRGKKTNLAKKQEYVGNLINVKDYWNATKDTMTKLHKIVMKHSRITH